MSTPGHFTQALDNILTDKNRQLEQFERELVSPCVRNDASRLDALLSEDFEEIGSSGRQYSKRDIVESVGQFGSTQYELSDFTFVELAKDCTLIKYLAIADGQQTCRSSIWILQDGTWRLRHHQSSVIAG